MVWMFLGVFLLHALSLPAWLFLAYINKWSEVEGTCMVAYHIVGLWWNGDLVVVQHVYATNWDWLQPWPRSSGHGKKKWMFKVLWWNLAMKELRLLSHHSASLLVWIDSMNVQQLYNKNYLMESTKTTLWLRLLVSMPMSLAFWQSSIYKLYFSFFKMKLISIYSPSLQGCVIMFLWLWWDMRRKVMNVLTGIIQPIWRDRFEVSAIFLLPAVFFAKALLNMHCFSLRGQYQSVSVTSEWSPAAF